jgi:general secretion pathway protein N
MNRRPARPRASRFSLSQWRPSRLSALPRSQYGAESTLETLRWERSLGAGRRWAAWGVFCGALAALLLFAPAAWLAASVHRLTSGHLLLAEARGSVWQGSAIAALGGGTGSRDARALPGRLRWTLRPVLVGAAPALQLTLEHACCLNGHPALTIQPGLGTLTVRLVPQEGGLGQWPAGWLEGIGTPWNTLQLGGVLRAATQGLTLRSAAGRWRVEGSISLDVQDTASRLSTLERLGSYRLELGSDPAADGIAALRLSTLDGALQLSGSGTLGPGGLHFRGEASATGPDAPALANLLNIIGRRDGARSVIAIG